MMRNFFSYKIVIGAILFGGGIFTVLVIILWTAKAKSIAQIPGTAIVKVIAAPTQTPPMPVSSATPTQTPSTSEAAPTPSGDINIAVGKYVQVSGTEGEGLRLHNNANVTSKVNYVAIDAELFLVKEGPVEADGYTWWMLEDPYNNNAVGWGVSNYLIVVQNP